MHSSRMRTARFSGRLLGGSASGFSAHGGVCLGGCLPHTHTHTHTVDRQAPVKILPCPKLRLLTVKWVRFWFTRTQPLNKILLGSHFEFELPTPPLQIKIGIWVIQNLSKTEYRWCQSWTSCVSFI